MTNLPVTQADRDAAAGLALVLAMEMTAHITRKGKHGADQQPLTQAFARHRISHSLPGDGRFQKYLADETAARERLATFPDTVRQRLINWQEGQSEWFSDTLLEIVAEFIAFDDASRAGEAENKAGGLWYRRWHTAQTRVNELEQQAAALTPSPCPGDGTREAIGRAEFLTLLDLVEDGTTWNSSPAQCVDLIRQIVRATRRDIANMSAVSPRANRAVANDAFLAGYEAGENGDGLDDALDRYLAALTPSALSGDAGEGAMSKRTLVLCVSGKGPTPHLEVHFANLADAHAAHNELLGIKEEAADAR